MSVPALSIVIGTLNEADNIVPILSRLQSVLTNISWEVIFVDDDSPDGTARRVEEIGKTDPRVRLLSRIGRKGLASACIEGMHLARAEAIAVLDADLQHDEKLLPVMFERLMNENLDIVIGSRHVAGGSTGDFSPPRKLISWIGQAASRLVLRQHVSDLMSGYFVVRRDFFNEVAGDLSGIGYKILFDILTSSRRKVRLAEQPFQFGSRQHGQSKMGAWVALDHVRLILVKFLRRLS